VDGLSNQRITSPTPLARAARAFGDPHPGSFASITARHALGLALPLSACEGLLMRDRRDKITIYDKPDRPPRVELLASSRDGCSA
jgi:hypothetical protein